MSFYLEVVSFLKCFIFYSLIWLLRWGSRAAASLVVACVVTVHRLGCLRPVRVPVPQPGIEPVSPALEAGFLTTGPRPTPPRKFCVYHLSDDMRNEKKGS